MVIAVEEVVVCPFTKKPCEWNIVKDMYDNMCEVLMRHIPIVVAEEKVRMESCKQYQKLKRMYPHPERIIPQMVEAFDIQVRDTDMYREGYVCLYGSSTENHESLDEWEAFLLKNGIDYRILCYSYKGHHYDTRVARFDIYIHRDSCKRWLELTDEKEMIKKKVG